MIKIGKTAQHAITVMEFLVECAQKRGTLRGVVSSEVVAKALGMSRALAGKILCNLSRGKIIRGASGPGGGYELTRNPEDIKLLEVVSCFESWGGRSNSTPSPFSEKFDALEIVVIEFLTENDFGSCVAA